MAVAVSRLTSWESATVKHHGGARAPVARRHRRPSPPAPTVYLTPGMIPATLISVMSPARSIQADWWLRAPRSGKVECVAKQKTRDRGSPDSCLFRRIRPPIPTESDTHSDGIPPLLCPPYLPLRSRRNAGAVKASESDSLCRIEALAVPSIAKQCEWARGWSRAVGTLVTTIVQKGTRTSFRLYNLTINQDQKRKLQYPGQGTRPPRIPVFFIDEPSLEMNRYIPLSPTIWPEAGLVQQGTIDSRRGLWYGVPAIFASSPEVAVIGPRLPADRARLPTLLAKPSLTCLVGLRRSLVSASHIMSTHCEPSQRPSKRSQGNDLH